MKKKIQHPEFAQRVAQAIDGNPDVPPQNFGRLRWLADRLAEHGISVTPSAINTWLHGEYFPRRKALQALAAILKADIGWLAGDQKPEFTKAQQRTRNAVVNGAVNAVAGFIQMDGGHPAFPEEDDAEAEAKKINLYAIIRGAKYNFHVTPMVGEGDESRFMVPSAAEGGIVLGVTRDSASFAIRVFELDWETIVGNGVKRNMSYDVKVAGNPWREIVSFAERI